MAAAITTSPLATNSRTGPARSTAPGGERIHNACRIENSRRPSPSRPAGAARENVVIVGELPLSDSLKTKTTAAAATRKRYSAFPSRRAGV